jgi:hypothetical protein
MTNATPMPMRMRLLNDSFGQRALNFVTALFSREGAAGATE